MANSVFISYRRADSAGEAGHLEESLEGLLDAPCVFRDVDDIQAGEDFDTVLTGELAGTQAVVVLIGKQWLAELASRQGRPEPDYVRIEIATALRLGKRIIPVLLQGAELPAADALPEDLRALVRYQALNMREEAWAQDAGRLADAIGRPYPWRKLAVRAVLALLAAVIATKYGVEILAPHSANQLGLARRVMFALLALYAAVELALWWKAANRQRPEKSLSVKNR